VDGLALRGRAPELRVAVLEAATCGWGPSGRDGSFIHGYWSYVPMLRELLGDERALGLCRAGDRIAPAVRAFLERRGEDAWLREAGMLEVATTAAQEAGVDEAIAAAHAVGRPEEAVPVERPGISPLYERSPVRPSNTVLLGEGGTVRARDVVVATNAAAASWGPVRGRMTVFGFTLANWQNPFGVPGLRESIVLSLAFALSVDDFVITNVNAGAEVTFPMYVWGAARVGVPPQVNVIGTVIFLLAIVAMLGNVLLQMRRKGTT
jgi:hypothetical protein